MTDTRTKDATAGMTFTLFIILPTDDVCSLRNLTSGIMIRELRCRLELTAGFPAQIYRLTSPDGQYLHEEHSLVLDHNVWDGYILRVNLFDSWLELFQWVVQDNVDQVYKNGGVCLKSGSTMSSDEEQTKMEDVIHERGLVALFVASFYGLVKMCQMLISVGVDVNGRTPFGNRVLHAACCKDREKIVHILVQNGSSTGCKNSKGDTPIDVAKKCFSKHCVRKIRMLQLNNSPPNGCVGLHRSSSGVVRTTNVSFVPHPPSSQRPHTSSQAAIKKRNTTVSRVVPPKDISASRSSNEYFMWDTDNQNSRAASASRFRLTSASSPVLSVGASSAMSNTVLRVDTAPGKQTVQWEDARTRVVTSAINRQQPGRHPVRHPHHSILKTRADNSACVQSATRADNSACVQSATRADNSACVQSAACGADSGGSQREHNDSDSHLSMVSAPAMAKDSSAVNGYDVRSVESAPDLQHAAGLVSQPPPFGRGRSSRLSGRKRSKLLVSRQRENESWKTMKRRITLAANQKKVESDAFPDSRKESFDQWLDRKRREEKRDRRETDSDDSESESESKARNTKAFDDWMKRQREKTRHTSESVTVTDLYRRQTRPLKGLIKTDIELQNRSLADSSTHLKAYKQWRETYPENALIDRDVLTLKARKDKMEEKRQRLLAMAISYEEWMEHNEERKDLMKEILQASMEELNKIEQDKLKRRAPRQISFQEWNEKTKLNTNKDRTLLRTTDSGDDGGGGGGGGGSGTQRVETPRSSAATTHDMWLKKKEDERRQKAAQVKQQLMKPNQLGHAGDDGDSEFRNWARRNNQDELVQIHTDIKRERSKIKALRNKQYTVSSC